MHDISTIAVSDSIPHPGAAGVRLPPTNARREPLLVRGAGLLACLDSLAAVSAILAVLISVSFPTISGVEGFLSARITVKNILLLIVLATAWPAVFYLFGLYDARRLRQLGSEARRLVAATTAGSGLALAFPLTSVTGTLTVGDLPHFWLASLALSLLVRTGRRAVDRAHHPHVRRTLIIGTGRLAQRAYRDLRVDRPHRSEVVGFIDEPTNGGPDFDRVQEQTVGTLEELEQILMRQVIDEVVIALPVKSRYQQIQYAIGVCERAGVRAKYGADLFESTVASPRYDDDGDGAFVAMHVAPDGYRIVVKRAIDVAGAAAGLVILAPLMLIVAIAIKLTSRGPVIYAQDRCGLHKRPLRMYKFRSMFADAEKLQARLEERNEAQGPVFKIRDDPRITRVGRLLRKSSLDELPQLWNVLCGDMSLVGPRPLPWRDVHRITRPSDMRRFSMRPGITCLWQVQGRANLSFERWVELDLRYIDTWSLAQDSRILLKTIPAVLSGDGAA
jgi:exopolysaccharide biosynthesis polyprenyl glycosylphosphotransferase